MKLTKYSQPSRMGRVLALIAAIGIGNCTIASAEPFTGQIMVTGASFCPRGWVEANGQLISIASSTALFSLYGTTYGGDGRTTFGLPDLRGRVAIHRGLGAGLSPRRLGERGGLPNAKVGAGDVTVPAGPPYLVLLYCIAMHGIYPSRG